MSVSFNNKQIEEGVGGKHLALRPVSARSAKRISTTGFTPTPILAKLFCQGKTARKTHREDRCRGFTILELLVVVAIIGILAAVTLALLSDTRARSRDAKRLSDMRETEKAINLYYAENNNFPIEETEITITGEDGLSTALESGGLISEVPTDPLHGAYTYRYQSNASGSDFTLSFCLETDTIQGYNADCDNAIGP